MTVRGGCPRPLDRTAVFMSQYVTALWHATCRPKVQLSVGMPSEDSHWLLESDLCRPVRAIGVALIGSTERDFIVDKIQLRLSHKLLRTCP